MQVFRALDQIPPDFGPSAVAIGKFDGVHAGHRAVIETLAAVASARGLVSAVLTFDRNPLSLLRPEICPEPLVSNAQKLDLLKATGIDATVMVEFDHEFADLTPEEFARTILVDALHASIVLVGSDFRFGAKGSGSVDTLRDFGTAYGFEVSVVADVTGGDERRASSTWVRELLSEGAVAEAATLLGHVPSIRSHVVHGAKRGRELGYPTANLAPSPEGLIPADGVYAAWATIGEDRFPAAVSVGNNPTFDGVPEKRVEAHLLDQDLDLYGRVIEVAFVEYIRGMVKYTNIPDLIAQIALDEQRVRDILGSGPKL